MTKLVRVPFTLATALAFHVSMSPPTGPAPSMSDPRGDKPGDRHTKICATARFITAMTTKVCLPTHTHLQPRPHVLHSNP